MWRCSTYEFDERMPIIMGILNVTPDSFSDGGQHNRPDDAIDHALKLVEQGAHIIDVGGESTRPGAAEVSVEEELRRTVGVVAELSRRGVCVSIDTRHAEVARACVAAGAAIINDVSGFRDPAMVDAAAACDAGLVVMHMRGEPSTMQNDTSYVDVVAEVRDYLARRVG
ncbi:MAG: dihydropteroate synthase, partial [Berryella intestinalis]|nr:dihydropteroate synthase [Berryella intestinalis]